MKLYRNTALIHIDLLYCPSVLSKDIHPSIFNTGIFLELEAGVSPSSERVNSSWTSHHFIAGPNTVNTSKG